MESGRALYGRGDRAAAASLARRAARLRSLSTIALVHAFALAAALVFGCSSNKPRAPDDAASAMPRVTDARPPDAATIDAPAAPGARTGDLQIRVEWREVPVAMRASPGRTACRTARTPVVEPTTTWGVPDVFVVVEGAAIPPSASRVVLADCALAPRVVAATELVAESGSLRPAKITFAKRGEIGALDKLAKTTAKSILLPIAGHAVKLPLEAGGVYELAADGETAWIVASPSAGVTGPAGQLVVRDLAPGKYAVTAWLPPRAGGPAKRVTGNATVSAGDLAELVLVVK